MRRLSGISLLVLDAAALLAAGCGASARDYTPARETARASLEAALIAWREGDPPGAIAGQPAVQVVDTTRQTGQALRSFEVLSETSIAAQGRCYVVRLVLENPAAERRERFVVVGIDPIWVFRKEDYDRLAHWEHPMELAEPAEADAATSTSVNDNDRS
jgi:hypothetical protein